MGFSPIFILLILFTIFSLSIVALQRDQVVSFSTMVDTRSFFPPWWTRPPKFITRDLPLDPFDYVVIFVSHCRPGGMFPLVCVVRQASLSSSLYTLVGAFSTNKLFYRNFPLSCWIQGSGSVTPGYLILSSSPLHLRCLLSIGNLLPKFYFRNLS